MQTFSHSRRVVSHAGVELLQRMSQNERKKRPPKRTKHKKRKESVPSSKRLKDNKKNSIPLKTSKKRTQDFGESLSTYFEEDALTYEIEKTSMSLLHKNYSKRRTLFNAITTHLFPLISLKRHYHNTLQNMDFQLFFSSYNTEDLLFLSQFFSRSSRLPFLTYFKLNLSHRLELKDFEKWGLTETDGSVVPISIEKINAIAKTSIIQFDVDITNPNPFPNVENIHITCDFEELPVEEWELVDWKAYLIIAEKAKRIEISPAFYSHFLEKTSTLRSINLKS